MEKQKKSMQKKTVMKIKKLEADLKSHLLLEDNWKKSKDALIKENKGLIEDLNLAQSKIKSMRRSIRSKIRVKNQNGKIELEEDEAVDVDKKRRIPVSRSEGGLERKEVKRSTSAAHLKRKERTRIRRQHSEKLRMIRLEAMKSEKIFKSFNKKAASNQKKFQQKIRQSNDTLINVYLKEINILQRKLDKFESQKKIDMKKKLSLAFDRFEQEKTKIIEHYKMKKITSSQKIKNLESVIQEKNLKISLLETEIDSMKSQLDLISKRSIRVKSEMGILKIFDQKSSKEAILSTIHTRNGTEDEVDSLIEKFMKEKKEMEENLLKKIEDLSSNNLELKVSHRRKVECLSQRIKSLESDLENIKTIEEHQKKKLNLHEVNLESDKENQRGFTNNSDLTRQSNHFPNFGNLKIQLAEKETMIQILNKKCEILMEENKRQSDKVNLLLEKLTHGRYQEFEPVNSFKISDTCRQCTNPVLKETKKFDNFDDAIFRMNESSDRIVLGKENDNCFKDKMTEEYYMGVLEEKDQRIKELIEGNKLLERKLKRVRDSVF